GQQFTVKFSGEVGGLAFDTTDGTLWVGATSRIYHYSTDGTEIGSFDIPVGDGRFADGLEFQGPPSASPSSPVITLSGPNPMTIECHSTFIDPGATAHDGSSVSLTVTVSGVVDANLPGIYTLTYTAIDPSGNTAAVARTVNVADTTK